MMLYFRRFIFADTLLLRCHCRLRAIDTPPLHYYADADASFAFFR